MPMVNNSFSMGTSVPSNGFEVSVYMTDDTVEAYDGTPGLDC